MLVKILLEDTEENISLMERLKNLTGEGTNSKSALKALMDYECVIKNNAWVFNELKELKIKHEKLLKAVKAKDSAEKEIKKLLRDYE